MLFIDNGGNTLKAIYCKDYHQPAGAQSTTPLTPTRLSTIVALNMAGITSDGSTLYGNSLLSLPHYHQLVIRRPTEKGFIVDAALQASLWTHCLFEPLGIVNERDIDLALTCPVGCPQEVAEAMETLIFEHFKFKSVTLVTSSMLAMVGCEIQKLEKNLAHTMTTPSHTSPEQSKSTKTNTGRKRARTEVENQSENSSAAEGQQTAPTSSLERPPMTGIVVDCGFSGTIVTPFLGGRPVHWNSVRIDVGGKVLTNYLKELITFSQVNLAEDTWLCNTIKELCCFCLPGEAANFAVDTHDSKAHHPSSIVLEHGLSNRTLSQATQIYTRWAELGPLDRRKVLANQKRLLRSRKKDGGVSADKLSKYWFPPPSITYVLPSAPQTQPLGFVLPQGQPQINEDWQCVRLGHECFVVGEGLVHPPVLGLQQVGVAEAVSNSIFWAPGRAGTPLFGAPPALQQALLSNVILVGGTGTRLKGFSERLRNELRPLRVCQEEEQKAPNDFMSVCSDHFALPTATASESSHLPAPSYIVSGALALFFGQHEKSYQALTGSTLLMDTKCTVTNAKRSRESMRTAVALLR